MKISHILILLGLVGLVFVGTIAMFFVESFDVTKKISDTLDNGQITIVNGPSIQNSPTTTPNIELPRSVALSPLDMCIESKKALVAGKEFKAGSLLVTFLDGLDYETALESVRFFGLTPDDSAESKNNFNKNHWLDVGVPNGEEFKWQCLLADAEGVKRTSLNLMFSLRQ